MPPNSTSETNKVSEAPASPPIVSPLVSSLDEAQKCPAETRILDTDEARRRDVYQKHTNRDEDGTRILDTNDDKVVDTYDDDDDEFDQGHHHDHDYEYQFSFRQMYHDTLNLDWSKVLWDMVFSMVAFHILSLNGLYYLVTGQLKWQSFVFALIWGYSGGLGVTMGVHRLWTHKAFKARWPLRLVLMMMYSIAFQESIYLWSQNHRVHHKWADTDRDFTNSRRGFFFAHVGWKMYQTHPEVIKGRKMIDCSDLLADPIVKFQHEHYYPIALVMAFIMPTLIPYYFFGEDLWVSFVTCGLFRLCLSFHTTWCINSVAHLYGYKPYDKSLHAYENTILGTLALGEGWHNYHHAFPRDYRSSELNGWGINFTTRIIELLNKVGLTYDLKMVTDDHLTHRISRTGDQRVREALFKRVNPDMA